jgi:DNA polymerase-3 subunit delta
VRAGSRNIAAAVETVIDAPSPECRVIIEAGNLTKSSPLRGLCEKAKVAAALPCYPDNERALASLIDEEMRANDLTIGSDARDELIALLGADRQASRNEIRKLALYAQGQKTIGLDDVIAVVADASQIALDGLVDAVFAGKAAEADNEFSKARASGSSPAAIVSAAIRQVASLHKMKLAIEGGDSIEFAMRRVAPPVHFSRERAVSEALRAWTPARLVRAMEQLAEASLDMRRNSLLAESIAQRMLLSLARNARKTV